MKKNLKQALVPLAVMVFGAAAAFATNAAKQSSKTDAIMNAYYYDITKPVDSRCVFIRDVNCSFTPGPVCTDLVTGHDLWADSTEDNELLSCTTQLFKP